MMRTYDLTCPSCGAPLDDIDNKSYQSGIADGEDFEVNVYGNCPGCGEKLYAYMTSPEFNIQHWEEDEEEDSEEDAEESQTMQGSIGFLNDEYSPQDEFILYQSSGEPEELPERIQEVISYKEAMSLDSSEWIMIIDGEVENIGFHHPFLIEFQAEE